MCPLSSDFTEAMNASQTSMVACEIFIIDHASLAEPLRFCTNGEDIMVDGELYTAIACEPTLPHDQEDGVPQAGLLLDNTDQQLTPLLRSISGELSVTIKQVRLLDENASPPTFQVEISFLPFTLSQADLTEEAARLSLTYDNGLNTEFPGDDFTPSDFPAMF